MTGSGITHIVYSMMQMDFGPLFALPSGKGLMYEASVVSGFYAGFVVFFYVAAWFYAAPTTVIAWALVAVPITGARVINRAFPEKPIAFVFFVFWLFSFLYLTYAVGS